MDQIAYLDGLKREALREYERKKSANKLRIEEYKLIQSTLKGPTPALASGVEASSETNNLLEIFQFKERYNGHNGSETQVNN